MLTLAIDTATKVCTIALARDGEILAAYDVNVGMTHSEGLLPQIEQLINRTNIEKKSIDLLAVSMGPGSFTGLRIGLATAEAMAYSWQCMLHGVDTLKALAYNIPLEGIILSPVLDAQKGNYYQAIYEWASGRLIEREAVSVVTQDEMLAKASSFGKACYLLGETKRLEAITLPANVQLAPLTLRMPKASSVALLAEAEHTEDDKKIFGLEPYYIRRSEAEELWEKRQQK
ncbi:MAG: tRNA (adenosine(37)-N6)-threonylcarbamoyltransferase complex dimerization subunit type 1 TsaB [Phascolarctobacterium sp.]|nr:tRNA (adenosine(37)-N6)-threonylcarbamoyltransferase complex dimerization subunit type 1 TsaB [Phascolarctobacterium sp.]